MKTLKFLTLALIFSCVAQSCTQNEATPNYEVANCGKITDPLKDIAWLKAEVEYAIANKKYQKIIMYDYNNTKIYYVENMMGIQGIMFGNCNLSINECNCGARGASEKYKQIESTVKNPVVLFEQQ